MTRMLGIFVLVFTALGATGARASSAAAAADEPRSVVKAGAPSVPPEACALMRRAYSS